MRCGGKPDALSGFDWPSYPWHRAGPRKPPPTHLNHSDRLLGRPMTEPTAAISLDEIRDLIRNLPGPDLEAGTAARHREARLTKPAGALGRLEEIAYWMASWQGRHPAELRHPRVAVFASSAQKK